jgi:UDP-N-acetyl-D-mannosaminuronic acid dehydrogenase
MKEKKQVVAMIGLGYIGLPTAALMASKGLQVVGVDVNPDTVKTLNEGKVHIVEPDLDELVYKVVKDGYLRATTTAEEAEVFIIAVPTPFTDGFKPDLSYIKSACESIAPKLKEGNLVILESTSPVGATDKMSTWLSELRPDLNVAGQDGVDDENVTLSLAHCPERVLPGKVLEELVSNDRVIGGITEKCSLLAAEFYAKFVEGTCVITNARTAEMAKLTENSFRDVNIAFANELSMICEKFDINVWELIELANRHPRVNILQPGCGVGGHCIAVDPWFIVDSAPELTKVIHAARLVNDGKPHWVVQQVDKMVTDFLLKNPSKGIKDVKISCYGLAFKPNIDDLRESPALEIAEMLSKKYSGQVSVVEPNINDLPAQSSLSKSSSKLVSQEEAGKADVKVVLVAHDSFKEDYNLLDGHTINVAWAN